MRRAPANRYRATHAGVGQPTGLAPGGVPETLLEEWDSQVSVTGVAFLFLSNVKVCKRREPSMVIGEAHYIVWIDIVDAVLNSPVKHDNRSEPRGVIGIHALSLPGDDDAATFHKIAPPDTERHHHLVERQITELDREVSVPVRRHETTASRIVMDSTGIPVPISIRIFSKVRRDAHQLVSELDDHLEERIQCRVGRSIGVEYIVCNSCA